MHEIVFVFCLLGLLTAFPLSQFAIQISIEKNLVDVPKSAPHKQHDTPTPLAGGLALMGSIALVILVTGLFLNPVVVKIMVTASIIFVFGFLDDRFGFGVTQKFLGQTIAAVLFVILGLHVSLFTSLFPHPLGIVLDIAATILWLITITNAFNLVDSMDGLAISLSIIACVFFLFGTLLSEQFALTYLIAILLGVCASLYYYNISPAKLFLGDSGSQTLGFLLAAVALVYAPLNRTQLSSWFAPILFMGIPIFDLALVLLSRMRKGIPFYKSDNFHTYHRLTALGFSPFRAVLLLDLIATVLGCIAMVAVTLMPVWANTLIGFVIVLGVIAFIYLENKVPHPTK